MCLTVGACACGCSGAYMSVRVHVYWCLYVHVCMCECVRMCRHLCVLVSCLPYSILRLSLCVCVMYGLGSAPRVWLLVSLCVNVDACTFVCIGGYMYICVCASI